MITGPCGEYERSRLHWVGLFKLPTLQRIYARNVGCEYGSRWNPVDDPPSSVSVTDIELRECILLGSELEPIIRSCKQLKSFIYELGRRPEDS
jgi:hypothetical protein